MICSYGCGKAVSKPNGHDRILRCEKDGDLSKEGLACCLPVAANEILGFTAASPQLTAVATEFLDMGWAERAN